MKALSRCLTLGIALAVSSPFTQADTLADIFELAVQNDATLKAAEATYRANLETANIARAALLPQITATASRSESDTDSEGFSRTTLTSTSSNLDTTTKSWDATLNQTLFDLSAWYTFRSGKQTSAQAEAQFAADQQNLIVRVAEAYFNVLRALDNLSASKAEERATQRQLEQTQQRFDVGLIAITDVHEAQAAFDLAVVQRLTDEGALGTAYEALSVLTGQTHANLHLLSEEYPVINPEPLSREEWVEFALANNYSLKAALLKAEAALETARAKKMGHAPTLTAQIRYSDDDTDGDFSDLNSNAQFPLDSTSDGTTWSVNLKVPIFAGGATSAQRRQAYEQFNNARQTEINTRRTVVQQTRSLHLNVTTDVQRVKARSQAIVSSRSALEATQAGYEVGTRNVVDVLQAQRTLFAALRDYANSRYDYVVNLLKLKQQAGTLTPDAIYQLNQWLVTPDAPTATDFDSAS